MIIKKALGINIAWLTIFCLLEDIYVKYIHSDAVLFLNKENKFHAANFAILDLKFTSSSIMEEWWEIIAFVKLQHKKFSLPSKFLTSKIDIKKLGSNILFSSIELLV